MKNRPSYAIESVDNALLLAQLLLLEGPMRVTDAAARLGVSPSTAHRLLAMLVYRDFAEQDADKRYRPGRLLHGSPSTAVPLSTLRQTARPHLQRLVDRTDESANLVVLTGSEARFVLTVECDQLLRVGDRTGKSLPAHVSSGGKAMLSVLDDDALGEALADLEPAERARVRRALRAVRQNGFAINNELTEAGLTAIGVPVSWADGMTAGISLAMPTARFSRDRVSGWVQELHGCARAIEKALSAATA
ncbi:helix-turn-helix domain-containing protein [Nocardioides sp. LMS-CY]|uniref:DNA-binding IclR family transcriptional regulator n=1 Tax=Nocardioides soli TaxID=1036020 RepID=A0A7W4Z447_9ACTN|nr:IclR family transcriptional regulator [Nocardioides sp. LMS-CY]MBB3045677.1 DNA-binding IclR family transcriptional regulator [Nocardioides soli]QWF22406.1 helix-turn-helix domain-containing protein [Nocardioides sp. LMS-CY]